MRFEWWIGVLLAVPVYAARAWPTLWTTVDDAWITARYARHLAEGHGLVYNAGEPPIEGYTNLLWTLWVALAYATGASPEAAMVLGGLACGAASVALAGAVARELSDRVWAPGVASLLVALDIHHAVVSTNGLESSLFLASLLAAAWGCLRAPGVALGLWLGAMAAIRPEGMVVAPLLLAGGLATRWLDPSKHHERSHFLKAAASMAAGWVALLAWRRWTYGAWAPNTFAAKATGGLFDNLEKNMIYLGPDAAWWIAVLVLWLAAIALGGREPRRLTLSVAGLALVAVAFRVHMWMPGGRLLVPTTALVAVLAACAPGRAGAALAALAVAGSLIAPFTSIEAVVRSSDRRHTVVLPNGASEAGLHLARHAPPESWLAVRDAGVLAAFVGTGVKVAETHPRALTQLHPDRADADLDAFVPKNPAFVALTQAREDATTVRYTQDRAVFDGLDARYTYLGRVYQHYHRYYDLYARADLGVPPLPPELVVNREGPPPRAH